ncbi:MAG: riboflavin synthase [Thermoanaerobaculia bacterium]
MFTGLVRERGHLTEDPRPSDRGGRVLSIGHSRELSGKLEVGASLAVSGVCLTVITLEPGRAEVELSPETLARTRLGRLRAPAGVNLEPALRVGDPLGGHFVQGHVDGLVRLLARRDASLHSTFQVELPPVFAPWVVEKGSVALDGVSLTIAALRDDSFDVALIPYTLAVTTLGEARPGDRFHFEGDVLAKYVARSIALPDLARGPA